MSNHVNHFTSSVSVGSVMVSVHAKTYEWLGVNGYDPEYGARPLARLIQNAVVDEISDLILAGSHGDYSINIKNDEVDLNAIA